jgi:MFS family permease
MPEDWVGPVAAAYGIGSLAGYVGAGAARLSGKTKSAVIVFCMLGESLGIAVLGFVTSTAGALALVFFGGVAAGFVGVHIVTILQLTTPTEIRGRIFGVLVTISSSLSPLGMGLGGAAYDWIGKDITLMFFVCGTISAGLIVLLSLQRDFREYMMLDKVIEGPTHVPVHSNAEAVP